MEQHQKAGQDVTACVMGNHTALSFVGLWQVRTSHTYSSDSCDFDRKIHVLYSSAIFIYFARQPQFYGGQNKAAFVEKKGSGEDGEMLGRGS